MTRHTYCQVLMSCSVHMDSRAVGLYMDSQKQKRKYISGIAAMTAGQILVYFKFGYNTIKHGPTVWIYIRNIRSVLRCFFLVVARFFGLTKFDETQLLRYSHKETNLVQIGRVAEITK